MPKVPDKCFDTSILDYPFNSLHNNVAYGSYLFKCTLCINKTRLEHVFKLNFISFSVYRH